MKPGLILGIVLSMSLQTAANAQGFAPTLNKADTFYVKDQAFYNEILTLATEKSNVKESKSGKKLDWSTTSVRGGADSGKPLGCYFNGNKVEYRSGYAKLEPKVWAEWTCALNDFLKSHGGGWDWYIKNSQMGMGKNDPLTVYSAEQQKATDPWDKSFVPYAKQEEYAKTWWSRYNPEFRKMGFVWKDWWLNDAILDGNLLIGREHLRNSGSADGVSYEDAVLAKLLKKQ